MNTGGFDITSIERLLVERGEWRNQVPLTTLGYWWAEPDGSLCLTTGTTVDALYLGMPPIRQHPTVLTAQLSR